MRLIPCQTASAGGPPSTWFFQQVPAPAKPSTIHPLSTLPCIHFWTCSDNRISGELSKQTAPVLQWALCVEFWIWRKLGSLHYIDGYRLPLHCQQFNREKKASHLWVWVVEQTTARCLPCKLIVFLSSPLICQMQRCWSSILKLQLVIFARRPQMDCVVSVEESIQMTYWLIYFNQACCTDTNCWHLYSIKSLLPSSHCHPLCVSCLLMVKRRVLES